MSVALTKSMIYRFLQETDLAKVARINEDYLQWLGLQPDPKEVVAQSVLTQ